MPTGTKEDKFMKRWEEVRVPTKYCLDIPDPNKPTEATMEILKLWVSKLHQSPNGREYIYKNLLGAIVKVLGYSRPFSTEGATSEQVRAAFELVIIEYSAASVWVATYKVLGWYTQSQSDRVMYIHIENIVKNAMAKKETFKDKLSKKADEFESKADIKEHLDLIKKKLEEFYSIRKFTLYLVKSKPNSCIAIGKSGSNNMSLFVPSLVDPVYYTELFINAFKELGFTDKDITAEHIDYGDHESYNITLKW